MILDNHIEKTEDSLQMLDQTLPQASADSFVYGLQQRKWTDWDILQFKINIRNSHSFAMMENMRLRKWGVSFNEEYATDHNTYFTTAERTMNRIHCTLSGIRRAVTKLCYSSRKQLPTDTKTPSVFERSPLLNGTYSPDLFGLDSYGQNVQELYKELVAYLKTAEENIALCIEVINRENDIRQNPGECMELHDKCYDITFQHSKRIIDRLKDSNANIDNDIMNGIMTAENAQETIVELFHMLNVDQWTDYVICRATVEAKATGLSTTELRLWGRENKAQVMKVRKLLAHIDALEIDKIKRRNALSGYFVMRLMYWCNIKDNSMHSLLLDYITSNYKGQIVKMGAINAEKRKLAHIDNSENKAQQTDFNQKIENFLASF